MRTLLVVTIVGAFAGLGIYDLAAGNYRLGSISMLLSIVNGLVIA